MSNKRPSNLKINKTPQGIYSRNAHSSNDKEIFATETPFSPHSPRKKERFVRRAQSNTNEVDEVHKELNEYIDKLDEKIEKYIQKNEGQFLIAYRNHVKKIREEMEEIRARSLTNANNSLNQTERIQTLEKQLIVFREDSLNLFDKLRKKQNFIQTLEKKIKDLQDENQYLMENLKQKTKKNKYLQGELTHVHEEVEKKQKPQNEFQFGQANNSVNLRPYTTVLNAKRIMRIRNNSVNLRTANIGKRDLQSQQLTMGSKLDNLLESVEGGLKNDIKKQIENYLTSKTMTRRHPLESRGSSFRQTCQISTDKVKTEKEVRKKNEMEQYFETCINVVRKQISRRKGIKTLNFYSEYSSLTIEQFKKLDFFRLLELILSQDKIIKAVHKALFSE